jgi:hypothetical protein
LLLQWCKRGCATCDWLRYAGWAFKRSLPHWSHARYLWAEKSFTLHWRETSCATSDWARCVGASQSQALHVCELTSDWARCVWASQRQALHVCELTSDWASSRLCQINLGHCCERFVPQCSRATILNLLQTLRCLLRSHQDVAATSKIGFTFRACGGLV